MLLASKLYGTYTAHPLDLPFNKLHANNLYLDTVDDRDFIHLYLNNHYKYCILPWCCRRSVLFNGMVRNGWMQQY